MNREKSQNLMQKIALLLQQEESRDDSAYLRQTLEKINARLDNIEAQISVHSPQSAVHSPKSLHPSLDKVSFIEELVDEIIANQTGEKPCIFEPKKGCDNCSMCNSRGF